MRRAVAVAAAAVLAAGCMPADGARGADAGRAMPGYQVRLVALDANAWPVRRGVLCEIAAYKGTEIITVDGVPYRNIRPDYTPARFPIEDYAEVNTIEIVCTMTGEAGDSFEMEITNLSETLVAPLDVGAKTFGMVDRGGGQVTLRAVIVPRATA